MIAVQGKVKKIILTVQRYNLALIPQPPTFPKISVYDESEDLIRDAVMTEINPGEYFYNFSVPIDKLGDYIVCYRVYDSFGAEVALYDDIEIVNADGAIEPRNFNAEAR